MRNLQDYAYAVRQNPGQNYAYAIRQNQDDTQAQMARALSWGDLNGRIRECAKGDVIDPNAPACVAAKDERTRRITTYAMIGGGLAVGVGVIAYMATRKKKRSRRGGRRRR